MICDIGDGDRVDRAARRPRRAAAAGHQGRAVPLDGGRTSPTPAGTTCTPPILLGVGLALAQLAERDELPGRVRLLFQPAEECVPVRRARGDRRRRAARTSRRSTRCTARRSCRSAWSACAPARSPRPPTRSRSRLTGRGGHTARPHLTADLVHALGRVIVDVPALLDRRVDPRAGVSMVWGAVHAGEAYNAIPGEGIGQGHRAGAQPRRLARGARADHQAGPATWSPAPAPRSRSTYTRGVPPVINDRMAIGGRRRRGRCRARRRPGGRGRDQHGRRGLLVLPGAGARRDDPAGHRHRRARTRSSTSTSPASTSTSGASATASGSWCTPPSPRCSGA